MNKTILITGASGVLGGYLASKIDACKYNMLYPKRDEFDLNNINQISSYIHKKKPSLIAHLAAETDVDLCEKKPDEAALRNSLATKSISIAASLCNAYIMYISTSNVFGNDGILNNNELDLPAPTNYYGKSKLAGERYILQYNPSKHIIIRPGWMIGGGPDKDRKFCGKILQLMKRGESKIQVVNDKYGSITYAEELATFMCYVIKNELTGLYHFASDGSISRKDLAVYMGEVLKYTGTIEGVSSNHFPLAAPRPTFETITSVYMSDIPNNMQPKPWKVSALNYLKEFSS
jgi:dTDP-4-dehydrorhamnose reductase